MSKARGLISGERNIQSRTSGMYDSDDNVRIANISNNGIEGLGLDHTSILENIVTTAFDFTWSRDGLHLYVAQSGDYINHYTVTKPFSSTGLTQVQTLDLRKYESNNYCIEMSPDGKYFYCGGVDRDTVFMFTTNTPYYVYNGVSNNQTVSELYFAYGYNQINQYLSNIFSEGSSDSYVRSIEFNGDGTKMYLTGYGDDNIQQFSLSTPYKIGHASDNSAYDGDYDLGADGHISPYDIRWNNDGSKFFILDTVSDTVVEYSVSNAYDVTTGTVTEGTNFSINSSYESSPSAFGFNADGTKMYVVGTSSDKIHEWTLSTGFDLSSTVTYVSGTSLGLTHPTHFDFSPDGTLMAMIDYNNDTLNGYTLSTGFDTSTISATQTIDLSTVEGGSSQTVNIFNWFGVPMGCRFNGDGTTITIMDRYSSSYDKAASVPLLIPYDVRGYADGVLSKDGTGMDYPFAVRFSPDGKRIYVLDSTDDGIYQWSLHTPYVIGRGSSVAVYEGYKNVGAQDNVPRGFEWTPDGKGLFVIGTDSRNLYFYQVETPFDITGTLTYKDKYYVNHFESTPYAIRIVNCYNRNDGGYKLQLLGTGSDDLFEFDINF